MPKFKFLLVILVFLFVWCDLKPVSPGLKLSFEAEKQIYYWVEQTHKIHDDYANLYFYDYYGSSYWRQHEFCVKMIYSTLFKEEPNAEKQAEFVDALINSKDKELRLAGMYFYVGTAANLYFEGVDDWVETLFAVAFEFCEDADPSIRRAVYYILNRIILFEEDLAQPKKDKVLILAKSKGLIDKDPFVRGDSLKLIFWIRESKFDQADFDLLINYLDDEHRFVRLRALSILCELVSDDYLKYRNRSDFKKQVLMILKKELASNDRVEVYDAVVIFYGLVLFHEKNFALNDIIDCLNSPKTLDIRFAHSYLDLCLALTSDSIGADKIFELVKSSLFMAFDGYSQHQLRKIFEALIEQGGQAESVRILASDLIKDINSDFEKGQGLRLYVALAKKHYFLDECMQVADKFSNLGSSYCRDIAQKIYRYVSGKSIL